MLECRTLFRTFFYVLSVVLASAAAASGCQEAAPPAAHGADVGVAKEAMVPAGTPIELPEFSAEWAVSTPTPVDWATCGTTGTPIADAKVSLRGGRLELLGDAAAPTIVSTVVVTVSGKLDLHNVPTQGNWQCAIDLFKGLEVAFPPVPIPNTPLTMRLITKAIGVLELGVEDLANVTGSIPFEVSAEVGVAAFAAYGGRFVPQSRILTAKFGPPEASITGAFKGYIEGNFGAGITMLINEVLALSTNAYIEPNFAWELPLSGCDMKYGLTSRWVVEGCVGAQTPPGFPGLAFEVNYCPQLKGENHTLLESTVPVFRLEPDERLEVAPGASAALPLRDNDTCLGPNVFSRLEGCPAHACAIDPGGQGVTFRAVEPDGLARAPGAELGTYCVRSLLDAKERCSSFIVNVACPADAKWAPDERACKPCDSPAECACQQPRAWNGTACLCPPDAPLYDAVSDLCTPCPVADSTYDPATNQCACGAPRQSDGFRCRCPREAPHFVPETGACEACPPNMVHDGERCVCVEPAILDGDQCMPPCLPPLAWDGYECRCPAGTRFEECFPEPPCPPPSWLQDGVCVCPPGASCSFGPGDGGDGGGDDPTSCITYECTSREYQGGCPYPGDDGRLVRHTFPSCGTPLAFAPSDGCGSDNRFYVTDVCGSPTTYSLTSCCNAHTQVSCRPLGQFSPSCS